MKPLKRLYVKLQLNDSFPIKSVIAVKRKRLQPDLIELFLWLILLSLLIYFYLPLPDFNNYHPTNKIRHTSVPLWSKNPALELAMQLVVKSGDINDFPLLLANHSCKRFTVPPQYRAVNVENFQSVEKRNGSINAKDGKYLRLECSAPFPIRIKYKGQGRPRFDTISVKKKSVFDEDVEAIFEVTVHFKKLYLEEIDSGRYICEAVSNKNLNEDEIKKRQKIMEIFVPGEMKLLHRSQFQHYLFQDSFYFPIDPITIQHDVAVNGKEVTVPCGVSNPLTVIMLFLKREDGTLESIDDVVYDPIDGFRVPLEVLRNSYGKYANSQLICTIDIQHKFSFKIVFKDDRNSRVSPSSPQVAVLPGQLPLQLFECEADEPIEIIWLNSTLPIRLLNDVINGTKYKVSFIATAEHLGGKETSKFQCCRKRDGMVIHIWEWLGNGVTKPHLSYNGKRKELSCCMNSVHAPQLLVETCSTMLECQVKASFQPKIASAGGFGVESEETKGCSVWTFRNGFQAGLIMCNQVNSNPFRDPVAELPPVIVKWNNDVAFIGNSGLDSKSLEKMVTMNVSADVVKDGPRTKSQIRIGCFASSLFFAGGFRWSLHIKDGEVLENVEEKSTWGTDAVISYQETFHSDKALYSGVLILSKSMYIKPLLKIGEGNGVVAKLQLSNTIGNVTCQAPLWNETSVWIGSHVDEVKF